MGPGAQVMMKPEQLSRWVARAQPGDDVVYSTGARPGDKIGAAVRALHAQGVVAMTSKRVDGGLRFIAQRLPAARASELQGCKRNAGQFVPARSDGAKRTAKAVLRVLNRAANRGQPCPTNAELARMVGLKDAVAASYRVRRLVKDGAIRVDEPSPLERRVVTIVATGKSTVRGAI